MKKALLLLWVVTWLMPMSYAQENFPVNGVKDERPKTYAFTNATIFVDYQTRLDKATLLIRDGKILAAGTQVALPKGTVIQDLGGKYIYPSWVEPFGDYGLPAPPKPSVNWNAKPQFESKKKGPYGWNENLQAEYNAIDNFHKDAKVAKAWKKAGFGAVNSVMKNGIMRGTSTVVSLADAPDQELILKKKAAANLSFRNGGSVQRYPNSIMGRVALIRQAYYDRQWYHSAANDKQTNLTLEAIDASMKLPHIFEVSNKQNALLADRIGDEFGLQYIIKGGGDEYQRLPEIKATKAAYVIPLNFPEAYEVDDPFAPLDISLAQMKHWELAPKNAGFLSSENITFAFTADGLEKKDDYLKNIRKAIKSGLSETAALKAMTYTPAQLLRVGQQVGALRKGMRANFLICSDNIFEDESTLYENWTQGHKLELEDMNLTDLAGKYQFKLGAGNYTMEVKGKPQSYDVSLKVNDTTTYKVKAEVKDENVIMTSKLGEGVEVDTRFSGWIDLKTKTWKGKAQTPDGLWMDWSATYREALATEKEDEQEDEQEEKEEFGDILYPFMAFGNSKKPQSETLLFKNATVWTNEAEGIFKGDVLVKEGKIAAVGQSLSANGAKIVDAQGKHLTSGIIDEHSHIALSGVNEGSHAIVSEVRMDDAINADDINIYRQLSGGVTAAQLLHGSANPVGGQSALVKFRWGASPQEMRIKGADGYIKFALGENVKQSNWGDNNTIRFPQTRMGVEQVFVDAFTRAKAYHKEWKTYNALSGKAKRNATVPRKDLQLEALAEILNDERFISCHSYIQSEINMLMKVAESFDFTVNTFTHILEGYKVADKMAKHGAGGSTFADWWVYKFEVREAIPYNAALMHQAGVTVAINSDDAEMARRLNQETAKAVKYGGMSEEEAWKMVTLNPAKLLHLEKRMGSIKVGKDADLVLWSDNPLSVYAKSEKTLVDGIVYYDIEKDNLARKALQEEKTRLINKMKGAKKNGAKTQKPKPQHQHLWHCDDQVFLEARYAEKDGH